MGSPEGGFPLSSSVSAPSPLLPQFHPKVDRLIIAKIQAPGNMV